MLLQPAQFAPLGEAALMVHTPLAQELAHDLVAQPLVGVLESVPALHALTVLFDPLTLNGEALQAELEQRLLHLTPRPPAQARQISVPVTFNGPDLEWCAAQANMEKADFAEALCAVTLEVAFVGFTAGFAYLTGLPEHLQMPRLPSPREHVPAGSVALGGPWAGVYPAASPGGWRIVGHTDLRPFDLSRPEIVLWQAGDLVRFSHV